ncbi:TrkH family potassium uptake protein [Paenibacillus thermotolerans]|uniref:TrkH family potassium uptake protein n=1 Tax=Paenibacillus thermotolerans TaxID=3027807 RepID=UPI003CC5D598
MKSKKWNQIRLSPPQSLATGFLIVIIIGTLLLLLPISTYSDRRISFIDALFEATSAVCVTGLVVTDTGTTFTVFGQVVLMGLIQLGGLGFMTFGILIALLLGKRISLSDRLLVQSAMNQFSLSGMVKLVQIIFLITLIIEGIGAALLAIVWSNEMGWVKALYFGLFHSISAFNNAGFDLMGNYSSLTNYAANVPVNLVISMLYILGGLGFTVIMEVAKKRKPRNWSLHTKLVLITTAVLIVVPSVLIFFTEYHNPNTLGPMPVGEKMLAAYFHGTVPRTAGFNTLDLSQLNSDTILLTMALMFIGGSSAGTAGGIKITTFLILLLVVWSFIAQKEDINILKRRIPQELIIRALTISMIGVVLIFNAVYLLELTEDGIPLMNLAFEAVSAFGTVGLSLGVTPHLSVMGKFIIMLLMFIGRLGPITIAFALYRKQTKANFQYPEEKILIG